MFTYSKTLLQQDSYYIDKGDSGTKRKDLISILFVDDEYVNYLYYKELLENKLCNISRAVSLEQALQMLADKNDYSLIIISASIPENFNYSMFRTLKVKYPDIPIISLIDDQSRYADSDFLVKGSNLCIERFTDREEFIEAFYEVLESTENDR